MKSKSYQLTIKKHYWLLIPAFIFLMAILTVYADPSNPSTYVILISQQQGGAQLAQANLNSNNTIQLIPSNSNDILGQGAVNFSNSQNNNQ